MSLKLEKVVPVTANGLTRDDILRIVLAERREGMIALSAAVKAGGVGRTGENVSTLALRPRRLNLHNS